MEEQKEEKVEFVRTIDCGNAIWHRVASKKNSYGNEVTKCGVHIRHGDLRCLFLVRIKNDERFCSLKYCQPSPLKGKGMNKYETKR